MVYLRQSSRYHDVVHQAQLHGLFALQRRPGPTEWQTDYLPRPKRRNHPLDNIPFRVTLTLDVALLIDLKATGLNHFCRHGQIPVWKDHPLKCEFQVAFAEEMSRLLISFQMPAQHASPRAQRPADHSHGPQVTQDRVTNCSCRRRKIRLLQSKLPNRPDWHQLILTLDPRTPP